VVVTDPASASGALVGPGRGIALSSAEPSPAARFSVEYLAGLSDESRHADNAFAGDRVDRPYLRWGAIDCVRRGGPDPALQHGDSAGRGARDPGAVI